jgi:hypothetical protein
MHLMLEKQRKGENNDSQPYFDCHTQAFYLPNLIEKTINCGQYHKDH